MRIFKIAAAAATMSLTLAVPPAMAQEAVSTTVAVSGGVTKLALSGAAKAKLRKARATATGRVFDVASGDIDPADAIPGTLAHTGKLVVKGDGGRFGFRDLNVQLVQGAHKLLGTTAGQEVTIADLTGGIVTRQGLYSTDVNDFGAHLSSSAAATLNKALGRKSFKQGAYLGQVSIDAQLEEASVDAVGQTRLQLAAQAAQKLQQAGVSGAPAAPATVAAGPGGLPRFSFPVAGGTVKLDQSGANLSHLGGLVLTKQSTGAQLTLSEPGVLISETPQLSVSLGGARAVAADLDLAGLTRQGTPNGLDLGGIVIKLNAPTAALMNQQFQTTVFAGGDVVGTVSTSLTFR